MMTRDTFIAAAACNDDSTRHLFHHPDLHAEAVAVCGTCAVANECAARLTAGEFDGYVVAGAVRTPAETKRCGRCEQDLPLDDFWLGKRGRFHWCRPCSAQYKRDRNGRRRERLETPSDPERQVCRVCEVEKPVDAFARQKSRADSPRRKVCRACQHRRRMTRRAQLEGSSAA